MKTISLTELNTRYKNIRPQEDYTLRSKTHPIFVVADGVTLPLEESGEYPAHSGAARAARLFCEAAIEEAEARFDDFTENDLQAVFEAGNMAVREYNARYGRTKGSIDYYRHDLFGATAAFALQKGKRLFWFSLCDSFVAVFSATAQDRFVSPQPSLQIIKDKLTAEDPIARGIEIRKHYRNSRGGTGYGVANGEYTAEGYLMSGMVGIEPGDFFALYTDGFEHYFAAEGFTELFNSEVELVERIRAFAEQKEQEDPTRFGLERSLIAAFV